MALSAGTAFVDVKPNLGRGFQGALAGKLRGIMPGVGQGAGQLLATGIVAGTGAAVVGLGALGAAGVSAFADLERGAREVRTLLPGMSDEAFGAMIDDVQRFAREAGVTTDRVLPALYQAISAGVPPDTVFDFLETANKAAIGGVSDLETAVDGLTSVVNAYGSDVVSVEEASDLLFTAVRLGKTDFDQLSSSLFQVIPTAAGTGVALSDITASIATLTAQGTPTRVVTTQLRQVLTELGKEGTKVAGIFEEAAGTSFRDFIAQGGNLQDALGILQTAAAEAGVNITDFFGSVEAGNAVLGLTSESGAALFTSNLAEMRDAAGATDTAFATMDQGISRTWDRIKATFQSTLTEIGERLAPFVERALTWFADHLPGALDTFIGFIEKVQPVVETVFGVISGIFSAFTSDATSSTSTLGGVFEGLGPIISSVADIIRGVLEGIRIFWDAWGETIMANIVTVFQTIHDVVGGVLNIIAGIIDVILGIITGDWSRAWDGVKRILKGTWDAIVGIIRGAVGLVVNFVRGMMRNFGDAVRTGISRVARFFRELPGRIIGFLASLPGKFVQLGADLVAGLLAGLGDIASKLFQKLKDGIAGALSRVASFFGIGSPSRVVAAEIGLPIAQGVAAGAEATGDLTTDVLRSGVRSAIDAARTELAALTGVTPNLTTSLIPALTGAALNPAAAGGVTFQLAEGAVQVNNPVPEEASTSVPRELRRLETQLAKG